MFAPDDHWALLAMLLGAAAFGIWAERTRWGAKLSGAVIAIGTTFVLSNLGVIPSEAPIYGMVWKYLVPLAIPMLLFKADLVRIFREAGPTLIAYLCGLVGTVLGTILAFQLVPLGDEGWKIAGIFCATYVGGSMNYAGAAEALDLQSGDVLTAGLAADNLMMTLYFLVLFALPSIGFLTRAFRRRPALDAASADATGMSYWEQRELKLSDLSLSLALGAGFCAVGYGLSEKLGWDGAGILIVTALAVGAATLLPRQMGRIGGADILGTMLMQIFFAAIGASANIAVVIEKGAVLLLLAGVILSVHLVFILVAGKLLRLDLREIVVASNANMGGPTTAAAFAIARRWDGLVIPAILCGTLGYAVATFIGVHLGRWLGGA